MLSARERIRAASMRARASKLAAAGREHTESLTSPLLVALPLAECTPHFFQASQFEGPDAAISNLETFSLVAKNDIPVLVH